MFKSKLSKVMGKVNGFIDELTVGIDQCAEQVGQLDFDIRALEDKQDALYNDLKAGEALRANLINLKGTK